MAGDKDSGKKRGKSDHLESKKKVRRSFPRSRRRHENWDVVYDYNCRLPGELLN